MAPFLKSGITAVLLLVPAVIGGAVTSFLLTPLLWRLEQPTGLELAGHSGPAEVVIYLAIAAFWIALLASAWLVARARLRRAGGRR